MPWPEPWSHLSEVPDCLLVEPLDVAKHTCSTVHSAFMTPILLFKVDERGNPHRRHRCIAEALPALGRGLEQNIARGSQCESGGHASTSSQGFRLAHGDKSSQHQGTSGRAPMPGRSRRRRVDDCRAAVAGLLYIPEHPPTSPGDAHISQSKRLVSGGVIVGVARIHATGSIEHVSDRV